MSDAEADAANGTGADEAPAIANRDGENVELSKKYELKSHMDIIRGV